MNKNSSDNLSDYQCKKAIAYQENEFHHSWRLPPLWEVAEHAKTTRYRLSADRLFSDARQALKDKTRGAYAFKRSTALEKRAIAFINRFFKVHHNRPTMKTVRRHLGVPERSGRPYYWPRFLTRWNELVPSSRQDQALKFLKKTVEDSGLMPRKRTIALQIGISPKMLSDPTRYPRFCNRYKALCQTYSLAPRKDSSRVKTRRDGKEDHAIEYQSQFFDVTGRKPTVKSVGKVVGLAPITLFRRKRFMDARSLLDARGAPKNRRQATGIHESAIACLKKIHTTRKWLPTYIEVAKEVPCSVSTLYRSTPFQIVYGGFAAQFLGQTEWGVPRCAKEGESIAVLCEIFDRSGIVPTWVEMKQKTGLDKKIYESGLFPIFRKAFCALGNQQRQGSSNKKETTAGNGKAVRGIGRSRKWDDLIQLDKDMRAENPRIKDQVVVNRYNQRFSRPIAEGKRKRASVTSLREARKYRFIP
jgi:hypothetical protein